MSVKRLSPLEATHLYAVSRCEDLPSLTADAIRRLERRGLVTVSAGEPYVTEAGRAAFAAWSSGAALPGRSR